MPTMQVNAFRMKLKPGFEAEYKKRHDEIWPELKDLLQQQALPSTTFFWMKPRAAFLPFRK